MAGRTFPAALHVIALLTIAGLPAACGGSAPPPVPSPPPVHVRVDRVAREVPPGTTLGELVTNEHLEASDGRLLSVRDDVLDRSADPGQILLNGELASPEAVASRVRQALQADPDTQALISADGDARHADVVRAIDLIKSAGMNRFAIQIERQ